jgi:hypothetical protein
MARLSSAVRTSRFKRSVSTLAAVGNTALGSAYQHQVTAVRCSTSAASSLVLTFVFPWSLHVASTITTMTRCRCRWGVWGLADVSKGMLLDLSWQDLHKRDSDGNCRLSGYKNDGG